ncbi:hypothetical protein BDV06DRAFT_228357 [Aspergillus oleicola]
MRLSILLFPLAGRYVVAESSTLEDPLEVLGKIEGLGNLKESASIASVLSSLIEGDGEGKDGGADVAGSDSVSSPLENLKNANDQYLYKSEREAVDLSEGLDTLAQIENVANIASRLFALVEKQGGAASSGEAKSDSEQDGAEKEEGNSAAGEPLDLLKSIRTVQQVIDLASGIGRVADGGETAKGIPKKRAQDQAEPPLQSSPTSTSKATKPSRPAKKQSTTKKLTASPSSPSPPPKPAPKSDILARLEAIQRFSKLAQRITVLSNEANSASYSERLTLIFSDPEVTPTLSYIFENAHKLLTPEVLNLVKTSLRTSPMIPDEYRSLSLTVADSLGAIFSHEFAKHLKSVKETLDKVGIDVFPAIETIRGFGKWAMDTFDADSIASMNKQVLLWRRALVSEEMGVFVEWISDPATIRGVTERISGVKEKFTAERIHALNELFEQQGILAMGNEESQAFGSALGERVRWYLSTEEGLSELQSVVNTLNELHNSHALTYLLQVLQKRAHLLTPDFAEDIAMLSYHVAALSSTDTTPQIATTLQDVINLFAPLLIPSSRAEIVLTWSFWADLILILNKISAIRHATFSQVRNLLASTEKMVQPNRVENVHRLIEDIMQTKEYAALGLLVPVNLVDHGNVSAVVLDGLEGMGMVDTTPVMARELVDMGWVWDAIRVPLAPSVVDKTRQSVKTLAEASSFLIQVLEIFQDYSDPETWDRAGLDTLRDEL